MKRNKGNWGKPVNDKTLEKGPREGSETCADILKMHIREKLQPMKSNNQTRKPFRQSRPQPIRNQNRGRENNHSRGSRPPQNQRGAREPQGIERNWDTCSYRITRPYQQQEQCGN